MPLHQPSTRPLPGIVPLILLCGVLAVSWLISPDTRVQAAPAGTSMPNAEAVGDLVSKLKVQQDAIVANQTKLEAQTALLKEEIRQARIFAARGGGARR